MQILSPSYFVKSYKVALVQSITKRTFFYWLTVIFNRVDQDRVKKVGPDRACSEWLLRNGASVKWKGFDNFLTDYNLLPDEKEQYFLQAVDATDSDIHDIGFYHFDGCKYIQEVKLVRCCKVSNEAIPLLSFLKNSLVNLEITDCKNVTDDALYHLSKLSRLQTLKLGQFPYVKNKETIVSHLRKTLPKCEVDFK